MPGRVISQQGKTRFGQGREYSGKLAVDYQRRVGGCALAQAVLQRWKVPECCQVALTIYNTALDVDNAQKMVLDGIKGVLIVDDRRANLRAIWVEHAIDANGPRLEIEVESCAALVPLGRTRKPRKA